MMIQKTMIYPSQNCRFFGGGPHINVTLFINLPNIQLTK